MSILSKLASDADAEEVAEFAVAFRKFVNSRACLVAKEYFGNVCDYLIWEACVIVVVFPGGRYGSPFFPDFDALTFTASTS